MDEQVAPTAVERWLAQHLRPARRDSARGLYELMARQRNGQLPFVDAPYDPWREDHWADAARVVDYAAQLPPGGRAVLDIGPGDGWPALPLAAACPNALVVGVDAAPRRTARCTANAQRLGLANARFVTGDAARLPFADASFDLVTAASALEEAGAPQAVFTELRRVLRPGGVLRVSYQDWRLGVPGFETVWLWEADGALLYSYVRRVQEPPLERRYTLALAPGAETAALHEQALLLAAAAPRAYGETLLTDELGVALLERLRPHVRDAWVVELARWSTAELVAALERAGFVEVRATVHPGELGRRFARELIARGAMPAAAPLFAEATRALGRLAASQPGDAMVRAVR
jgi:SAM-dependent methyltransferase